jgi:polyhydroxyalkanoate synthesis regulator phasin
MDSKAEVKKLRGEIEILKIELQDREKSLPAHSIRPHQLLAIEDLEEKIHALQERVKQLESPSGKET